MAIGNTNNKPAFLQELHVVRGHLNALMVQLEKQATAKSVLDEEGVALTAEQITALDNALGTAALNTSYNEAVDIFQNVNPV